LKLKHSQDNKQEAQWKYKKKGTSIIDKWNTANIMPIGYSSMQEGLSLHAMHTHHFCKSGATIPTYMQGHTLLRMVIFHLILIKCHYFNLLKPVSPQAICTFPLLLQGESGSVAQWQSHD
jgi:hypothetical protein